MLHVYFIDCFVYFSLFSCLLLPTFELRTSNLLKGGENVSVEEIYVYFNYFITFILTYEPMFITVILSHLFYIYFTFILHSFYTLF